MNFLPEEDVEYLNGKGWGYELKSEQVPDGTVRNAVIFSDFHFTGSLFLHGSTGRVQISSCDLLVLIPPGYSTTQLDSFYTIPHLKRMDGSDPLNATGDQTLFQKSWQFWSRHLDARDWHAGIDGLDVFVQFILSELRKA